MTILNYDPKYYINIDQPPIILKGELIIPIGYEIIINYKK